MPIRKYKSNMKRKYIKSKKFSKKKISKKKGGFLFVKNNNINDINNFVNKSYKNENVIIFDETNRDKINVPTGIAKIIPSILSNIPPCPGISFPVSLILAFLLKKEMNKSPN